jgi:hypothetical protein
MGNKGVGAVGTSGMSAGAGNAQIQDAFNQAIAAASQTLMISTQGQATLNALRARPN